MELDRYLRALLQRWYLVASLVVVGLVGSWVYLWFTSAATANAAIAVLEPAVLKSVSGGQQAQLNFASIAESRTVAQRVARKLGLPDEAVEDKVSVKLTRTLVSSLSMPLYSVKVKAHDPALAVRLANAVIDESRQVFLEMNGVDRGQVNDAFKVEEDRATRDVDQARADLRAFEDANQIWRLDAQIDAQIGLVNALRQAQHLSNAGDTTTAAARTNLDQALASAAAAVTRLRGLQPEYDRLTLDVNLATAAVSQYAGRENDVALANDPAALDAVRQQGNDARARLQRAKDALTAFQQANGIGDLNAEMATQVANQADLRRQSLTAGLPPAAIADELAPEETELQRLLKLAPQHDELAGRVTTTQAVLANLQARKFDLIMSSILPPGSQIKVLDAPHFQPDTFWSVVLYSLGALLGSVTGLMLVYLLAYFDCSPQTISDVQALFGTPVLVVRVPSAN